MVNVCLFMDWIWVEVLVISGNYRVVSVNVNFIFGIVMNWKFIKIIFFRMVNLSRIIDD